MEIFIAVILGAVSIGAAFGGVVFCLLIQRKQHNQVVNLGKLFFELNATVSEQSAVVKKLAEHSSEYGFKKVAECFTDMALEIAKIKERLDSVCDESKIKELIDRRFQ